MELFFSLGVFVFLLGLGWFVGRSRERRHLQDLDLREARVRDMLVTQIKSFPSWVGGDKPPRMIVGEAVIGADYLKTFLGGLRNIFGGEVHSYETMLTRSRREATLRVLEQARHEGFNAVCNLRLQTADSGGNASGSGGQKRGLVVATILAIGTAYHARK